MPPVTHPLGGHPNDQSPLIEQPSPHHRRRHLLEWWITRLGIQQHEPLDECRTRLRQLARLVHPHPAVPLGRATPNPDRKTHRDVLSTDYPAVASLAHR